MADRFGDLSTPCLILDADRLEANLARMDASMARLGVPLRPHVKTAKSAEVAKRLAGHNTAGITVSTLREAEYFADHGIMDITYAVGIAPAKLARAAALVDRGVDLKVIVDTVEAAQAVAASPTALKLLAEVDCGDCRGGVDPEGDALLRVAEAAGTKLAGVLTHAGHSYDLNDIAAIQALAETERKAVVTAAERLRAAGHTISIVSAGSSPTALYSQDATGLSEYRAGVFVFFDLDQQSRGVCAREDLALSVLTTVIGHNRGANKILLDAGGLAMSKDVGANKFRPEVGYGEVCDLAAKHYEGLYVRSVSQEHGHVPVSDPSDFDRLPVGTRVRVFPNHACMTAAAYQGYNVLVDGQITGVWGRCNGW